MRSFKGKNLFSRGVGLSIALALAIGFLELQLQADRVIILWTFLIALLILGGLICLMPLEFTGENSINRWYNTAYWAGCVVCVLFGALLISAAVIWALTGPALDKFPSISVILIFTVQIGGFVSGLVLGGLLVIGKIAQGNEETRVFARSWGRTRGAPEARPAEENTPPE